MITILLAILCAAAVSFCLCKLGDAGYGTIHASAMVIGVMMFLVTGIASIAYAFCGWNWYAAEHKAKIINREYGTNYTQAEVFYAHDVIDTIRQLDRSRIEVNGNIMRAKP